MPLLYHIKEGPARVQDECENGEIVVANGWWWLPPSTHPRMAVVFGMPQFFFFGADIPLALPKVTEVFAVPGQADSEQDGSPASATRAANSGCRRGHVADRLQ